MHKSVILYSGGMDSLILARMHPDALKLYVDVSSRYSQKERAHLPEDVTISQAINLGAWERADSIIPCRNLFLALVAVQYGDTIMLGATAGDKSRDKDETWANSASLLLSYMLSGSHFQDPRRDPSVQLPIKGFTKGQLVAWYLEQGHDPTALLQSVSCYDPHYTHCGHCKSCMRKWVALEHNGILSLEIPGYWETSPATPELWAPVTKLWALGQTWRTEKEDEETRAVLFLHGIVRSHA